MPAPSKPQLHSAGLVVLLVLLAVMASAALARADSSGSAASANATLTDPQANCDQDKSDPGIGCQPGRNRQIAGGGGKVSHKGWPAVSGILWQDAGDHNLTRVGTAFNDEMLGGNGNDNLDGGAGNDILWGDSKPSPNGTSQRDVLSGGPGRDFIYTSHGTNTVDGGAGNDYIFAYYGHGTIDCGPGYDQVKVRLGTGQFKLKNCEQRLTFCAFGSKGNRCLKPGEHKAIFRRTRHERS